ncbi:MAG: hypothetical protein KBT11_08895 [Treponema sp.]|nr:hypothetical protein [Candidatus Treponema equifaecale]
MLSYGKNKNTGRVIELGGAAVIANDEGISVYELSDSDGQVYVYPATWWDFDHKLLDYNADALGKKDSMLYKNIYLFNLGDFTNFKGTCAFCKKALSVIDLICSGSLKPRLGSAKDFDFCSVDCGKKWIDAEGSKYRDLGYEKQQQLKQAQERLKNQ